MEGNAAASAAARANLRFAHPGMLAMAGIAAQAVVLPDA